jgi:hypothetical protein
MTAHRIFFLMAALFLIGCGKVPAAHRTVQADTLFGFKLGTLYPDVLEQARVRDILLACSEGEQNPDLVFCEHPLASPLDFGPYTLMFDGGRLVYVSLDLKDSWLGDPLDSLLGRQGVFGSPTDVGNEDGYFYQSWKRGDIVRVVSCNDPKSAADCTLSVSLEDDE